MTDQGFASRRVVAPWPGGGRGRPAVHCAVADQPDAPALGVCRGARCVPRSGRRHKPPPVPRREAGGLRPVLGTAQKLCGVPQVQAVRGGRPFLVVNTSPLNRSPQGFYSDRWLKQGMFGVLFGPTV